MLDMIFLIILVPKPLPEYFLSIAKRPILIAGIVLFFIESINDIGSIDLLAMWIIYFINSIYGYFVWRKSLMLKEVEDAKDIS